MTNPAGNIVAMVNAFTGHAPMDARLDILGDCARKVVIQHVISISVTPELACAQRGVRSAGRVCSVKVTTVLHTCKLQYCSIFFYHKCHVRHCIELFLL